MEKPTYLKVNRYHFESILSDIEAASRAKAYIFCGLTLIAILIYAATLTPKDKLPFLFFPMGGALAFWLDNFFLWWKTRKLTPESMVSELIREATQE